MKITSNLNSKQDYSSNNSRTYDKSPSFGSLNADAFVEMLSKKSSSEEALRYFSNYNPAKIIQKITNVIKPLVEKFTSDGLPELKLRALSFGKNIVTAKVGFSNETSNLAKKIGYGDSVLGSIKLIGAENLAKKMGYEDSVLGSRNLLGAENLEFCTYESIEKAYLEAQMKTKDLIKINNLLEHNPLIKSEFESPDYMKNFAFLKENHPHNAEIIENFINGFSNATKQVIKEDADIKIVSVLIKEPPTPRFRNEIEPGKYQVEVLLELQGQSAVLADKFGVKKQITQLGCRLDDSNPDQGLVLHDCRMNAHNGSGEIVGMIKNSTYDTIVVAYNHALKLKDKLAKLELKTNPN